MNNQLGQNYQYSEQNACDHGAALLVLPQFAVLSSGAFFNR